MHDTCPGGGMVDALASGASALTGVEVRVFSWAPKLTRHFDKNKQNQRVEFCVGPLSGPLSGPLCRFQCVNCQVSVGDSA